MKQHRYHYICHAEIKHSDKGQFLETKGSSEHLEESEV